MALPQYVLQHVFEFVDADTCRNVMKASPNLANLITPKRLHDLFSGTLAYDVWCAFSGNNTQQIIHDTDGFGLGERYEYSIATMYGAIRAKNIRLINIVFSEYKYDRKRYCLPTQIFLRGLVDVGNLDVFQEISETISSSDRWFLVVFRLIFQYAVETKQDDIAFYLLHNNIRIDDDVELFKSLLRLDARSVCASMPYDGRKEFIKYLVSNSEYDYIRCFIRDTDIERGFIRPLSNVGVRLGVILIEKLHSEIVKTYVRNETCDMCASHKTYKLLSVYERVSRILVGRIPNEKLQKIRMIEKNPPKHSQTVKSYMKEMSIGKKDITQIVNSFTPFTINESGIIEHLLMEGTQYYTDYVKKFV